MGQAELVGRTIGGRFRIESRIGEGAMGRVYRARQTALGTWVALKVLHEDLARLPAIEARFLREAQAASRIDHPSSVRVIDFGKEEDGLLYLAMELLEGRSLAEILTESGPLPAVRIIEIASQVLAALAVAHELGVVHRDLKPENIMVVSARDDDGNPHDVVKVCDFGIAKIVDGTGAAPTVTQEGMILGTPAYMSPEQARGEPLDGRSDVYAMGVLLFQMMTGEVPFDATSAFGTALMHVTDEPTKPTLLVPTVDSRLEAICLKAMRKRPEDRYASARELRTELRGLLAHVDPSELAMRPSQPPRKNGEGSIAPATLLAQVEPANGKSGRVVIGVALAGAALVAAFLFGKGTTPAPAPEGQPPVAAAAVPAKAPEKTEAPPPAPPPEVTAEAAPAETPAPAPARAARRTEGTSRSASRSAPPKAPPATATTTAKPKPATVPVTVRTPAATSEGEDALPSFIPRTTAEPAAPPPAPAPALPPAPEKAEAPAAPPRLPAN